MHYGELVNILTTVLSVEEATANLPRVIRLFCCARSRCLYLYYLSFISRSESASHVNLATGLTCETMIARIKERLGQIIGRSILAAAVNTRAHKRAFFSAHGMRIRASCATWAVPRGGNVYSGLLINLCLTGVNARMEETSSRAARIDPRSLLRKNPFFRGFKRHYGY